MNEILVKLDEIKELLLLNSKPMLNTDELSKLLGISKEYLHRLTANGQIKFYRPFGKLKFFDKQEIMEALKKNPVKSSSEIMEEAARFLNKSKKYK